MPYLIAKDALRERYGSLSPDDLYRALILTGVDPVKADYERSRRTLERMAH